MAENSPQKKFIYINRLTSRELVKEDLNFWRKLPNSPKDAKKVCDFYFTGIPCTKAGHISPRRTVTRECLMCEISPERLNKKNAYYKKNKKEISKKQKKIYKELTKDSNDSRYNQESPEKQLGDILEEINSERTLEEYIKKYDERISKIIKDIENYDKYFLGNKCHFGHNYGQRCLRINYGSKTCYKCKLINGEKYSLKNKEIISLKNCLKYHNLDEDKKNQIIKKATIRNQNNPDEHKKASEKYRKNNPEKIKETNRKDRKTHPDRVNAHTANRRAKREKALPDWLSKKAYEKIDDIFCDREKIQNKTGVEYEVDHIMPIDWETSKCCGLHVPWNLEVITRRANRKKGNKLPSPDRYTAKQQDRSDMIDKNWDTK